MKVPEKVENVNRTAYGTFYRHRKTSVNDVKKKRDKEEWDVLRETGRSTQHQILKALSRTLVFITQDCKYQYVQE